MAGHLGIPFPGTIRILAMEIADPYRVREGLTASATQALPAMATRALPMREAWLSAQSPHQRAPTANGR